MLASINSEKVNAIYRINNYLKAILLMKYKWMANFCHQGIFYCISKGLQFLKKSTMLFDVEGSPIRNRISECSGFSIGD